MLLGTFRIGEDITIALDAVSGDPATVSTITATMLRVKTMNGPEFDADAYPVTVTVAPRVAAGDIPAGWNLTVPASISAGLAVGIYGIDAKLTGSGGSIDITDTTAFVSLTAAATG
jgi:hypothetical protein